MGKYLLIESRDPFESQDSLNFYELAESLVKRGNDVVLFFVQNGVLPCRKGSKFAARVSELSKVRVGGGAGSSGSVSVLADTFSLRERGITEHADGIQPAGIDRLVDLLVEPERKPLWH